MSNILLYKIIVRSEPRDGPPRPSAHHGTGRLNKKMNLNPENQHFTWKQKENSLKL